MTAPRSCNYRARRSAKIGGGQTHLPAGARNVLMELGLLVFMAGVAVSAGATIVETFMTSSWRLAVAGPAGPALLPQKSIPKIIDFGVAKATAQRLTERAVFTELGQLIGTPEYMSPEQAEMTVADIDTRTDVCSLGVLLYELLVGALPFDPKGLRKVGFDEIRRRIREEEPSQAKHAVQLALAAAEKTGYENPGYLDTLSRAYHVTGDTAKAIENQKKAIALLPEGD